MFKFVLRIRLEDLLGPLVLFIKWDVEINSDVMIPERFKYLLLLDPAFRCFVLLVLFILSGLQQTKGCLRA